MDQETRDLRDIQDVLNRYAWMVDKRKWELMDQVFAVGGTLDYATTGGPGALPYQEALAWLDTALKPWPINLHHITNVSIELNGDTATARCAFHAPMGRERPGGGQEIVTNGGYYYDTLSRTKEGWRITERVCDMILMIGTLPANYSIPKAG
jgi:hypothetical protein